MDFEHGFTLLRELGESKDGAYLSFSALTAIHYAHRLGAYVVLVGMGLFAWRLGASGVAALRPWAAGVAGIALWQLASGLSNVLLGWPLFGAVAHTAGAAAWVVLLTMFLSRVHVVAPAKSPQSARGQGLRAAP
jgi:cytochrome c oxidase assembly protein subunit 15